MRALCIRYPPTALDSLRCRLGSIRSGPFLRALRCLRSVARPQAWGRQFEEVAVGVAKVKADPAARPFGATLDRDAKIGEAALPLRKLVGRDRERDVMRPAAVM